jgi:UDP-N-acetylmuramoyl-tripeptide--D-alanyl-D-alanine ligase
MATTIPTNRCGFDAAEICRATGALFSGDPNLRVDSVSIDTRRIQPGALFIALRGVRDGHDFVDAAANQKAVAAIVERGRRHRSLPCFEVDDPLVALGELASRHLQRIRVVSSLPVVAIGGAAGKTTTKEFVAAMMRALFGEILATPGNLNNLIGVPMTLLTLNRHHRAAVLECGTNQRGEIKRLSDILTPDVALVLNADIEHTEGLGSLEGVADEEAALFAPAHCAIVSTAEKLIRARVPAGMRVVTFGAAPGADVRLVSRAVVGPGCQQIRLGLAPWMVDPGLPPYLATSLNLPGEPIAHNAAAAMAACAVAWARPFGKDQIEALRQAMGSATGESGRLTTSESNGIVIIDDSYNANPRSVRAALAAARETADALGARLVVALGDMLELGELSSIMHAAAVREVFAARPEEFVVVGSEFMAALAHLAQEEGTPLKVHLARTSGDAAAILLRIIRPGDVLLVKGSRAIGMEEIIDRLSAARQ